VKLLLDTHVWLWSLAAPDRLSPSVVGLLSGATNDLYLSAASCWEIAIKYQLGKLPLPDHPEDFIGPRLLRDGIHGLQVSLQHAARVARLPMVHRDPFDRLLVSQSQIEKIALISADPIFAHYDIELIRC